MKNHEKVNGREPLKKSMAGTIMENYVDFRQKIYHFVEKWIEWNNYRKVFWFETISVGFCQKVRNLKWKVCQFQTKRLKFHREVKGRESLSKIMSISDKNVKFPQKKVGKHF